MPEETGLPLASTVPGAMHACALHLLHVQPWLSKEAAEVELAHRALGATAQARATLDATGDLVNSDALVIYGTLSCGSGGYGMTGNLFINTDGSLNVYMAAAGYSIYCPRVSNWYGTCTVYDINGYQIGTGSMQLL